MGRKHLTPRKSIKKKESQSNSEILAIYLKEIEKYPILTREEENDLAKRMMEGDEIAKEKLIKSNLRFVVSLAMKYKNKNIPMVDLINEGNTGLIMAAQRYDYTKGFHFITYAVWWIRNSMLRAIMDQNRMIRLPMNRVNQLIRIKRFMNEKKDVNQQEIMKQFSISQKHLNSILTADKNHNSLDAPIISESSELTMKDVLVDIIYGDPDSETTRDELRKVINEQLKTLTKTEELILKHRFGLDNCEMLSLQEIGEKVHLTKERIRQLEKLAISKMQMPFRSNKLADFVYN